MADPTTPAEWQEAVNAAAGCRAIADCKMYGLIRGGPAINIERCDYILKAGAVLGAFPSAPAADLALALARENNAEVTAGRSSAQSSEPPVKSSFKGKEAVCGTGAPRVDSIRYTSRKVKTKKSS